MGHKLLENHSADLSRLPGITTPLSTKTLQLHHLLLLWNTSIPFLKTRTTSTHINSDECLASDIPLPSPNFLVSM